MRILFVTSYPLEYNTSANIRNMGLIHGFLENGHSVSTFSSYPTDPTLYSGEYLDFPFNKRYWVGSKSTIVVDHTKKTLFAKLKILASKLITEFAVYDRRVSLARSIKSGLIKEEYDYIISSSDLKSSHVLAEKLLLTHPNKLGKWIQYWGDPFSNDISNNHRFSAKRIVKEEERLLRIADKVVYVSPFTRDEMASKYPFYSNKLKFLPIPFIRKAEKVCVEVDKELVAYLGDYNSKNRNILPFVKAVKDSEIRTVIAGTSDLVIENTNTLSVLGRLQGSDIEELSEKTGVFVCICNLYGTQIPGKVYHYVDTGKPILVILDGDREDELKKYFETYNRFYLCQNKADIIAKTLKSIISDYRRFSTPHSLDPATIADFFLD